MKHVFEPVRHVSGGRGRFKMGKREFTGHQFPEAKAEAEDIGFAGVLRALSEHLGGHPSQVAFD
jgi:hypothetical protein